MVTSGTWSSIGAAIESEESTFRTRQARSLELTREAREYLAGGVASSRQSTAPHPFWVDRGVGSRIWDQDGNEFVDLHGGHGAMLVGHSHPAIVRAGAERLGLGTHFGQPVPDAIVVARNLSERFGLPQWRFNSSGTEATHDAVRLMRAITGRRILLKTEGGYHGHHESVLVSLSNSGDELGPVSRPASPLSGAGVLREFADWTRVVPWNDLGVLESVLEECGDDVAGIIVEPILMNFGMVRPDPGYLEGVRALTRRYGCLLAYDEVKSGLVVDPGGATALLGVRPDIVCLAKAFGGGIACGAIGGTSEVGEFIASGKYLQIGTFNGNPLHMAMSRAALTEVLTPQAYATTYARTESLARTLGELLSASGRPGYVDSIGAKGMITFAPHRVATYRDFLSVNQEIGRLHWLFQHNRGVFMPPWGAGQPWLVSVQHTDEDLDLVAGNFEELVARMPKH
ncbi:aspartate aminotransferase family protein [Acrocarpospora pleiomorpha]|uniref:Aspartate aminotransferase family protein n=1 Tax=Acrocarpospora pleiomorpha TaxID=90975 RepID=A0A5M3Y154_9ACTN|nr:aminotransferase class III-fold pyridoxal phosphate-dependent enzyme [Acrocarpospora pleiomorpha]GES27067.1 aspartate aminotransferase family protein [Acrocarpospora pleiomorpha]